MSPLLPFLVTLAATAALLAQHVHELAHDPDGHTPAIRPSGEVRGPLGGVSATPTIAFDRAERLRVAWTEGSHVFVSSSSDMGGTFDRAVRVTPAPEDVDANGESRPKIAIGPNGEVYTSWTRKGTKPYTGDIRFARSLDDGRTFTGPRTVNDDHLPVGHRFDALHVGPRGTVYLAWIDKRDLEQATGAGATYHGAALYYATSADRGATFSTNRRLKHHVCECCRIAIDFDVDVPVVFWRDIIDGSTRDHGITRFTDPVTPGPARRATRDGWRIDACPHHGPSLSIAADRTYHLAWFTGEGPEGAGLFYARSTDGGRTLTGHRRVGTPDTFGHAAVLSLGRRVYLAWKEGIQPRGMSVHVSRSDDGGVTWTQPKEALRTEGTSDHPFLVARGHTAVLSWFSANEGLRLVSLPAR